ncbi:nuclease-related domain-containing protein [Kineococcus sp. SYSU DK004]|uniref:nuclease-related domain-containing protein n=1 Tax=Kineococcus sp. SYSU DK004 TaxID=3383125 RepID=UPI003D7C6221
MEHRAAGQGAAEQAARYAEQVQDLRARLADLERRHHAWAAGAEGERLVGEVLDGLVPHGWRVLHDVHWPGRQRANIDHLAVGPGGVVVVDSKNWSGTVDVQADTLRVGSRSKAGELAGVRDAAAAVTAHLPPRRRTTVAGVLCLVQQDVRPRPVAGVTVVGRAHLVDALTALPAVLSPAAVEATAAELHRLTSRRTPPTPTTADLARTRAATRELPARARGTARRPTTRTATRPAGRPPVTGSVRRTLARFLLAVVLLAVASAALPALVGSVTASIAAGLAEHLPVPAPERPAP